MLKDYTKYWFFDSLAEAEMFSQKFFDRIKSFIDEATMQNEANILRKASLSSTDEFP